MDKLSIFVFDLDNEIQLFFVVTSILIRVECSTSEFIASKSFMFSTVNLEVRLRPPPLSTVFSYSING